MWWKNMLTKMYIYKTDNKCVLKCTRFPRSSRQAFWRKKHNLNSLKTTPRKVAIICDRKWGKIQNSRWRRHVPVKFYCNTCTWTITVVMLDKYRLFLGSAFNGTWYEPLSKRNDVAIFKTWSTLRQYNVLCFAVFHVQLLTAITYKSNG